jgi:CPA1 family monovalent cation:H+ antiporter
MLLLPFAAYVLAERLEVSGILSAVAAGMMQSWVDLLPRQTSTRLLNRSVWTLLEFAFNGLIFLLLGLQLPDIISAVTHHEVMLWPTLLWRCLDVLAIFVVLAVLRYVWVRSVGGLMMQVRRWRGHGDDTLALSSRSSLLLTIGGVRGAVTLAGTLSVPMLISAGVDFPERDLLIFIAAGVILLSLVSASVCLPLLLRGLVSEPDLRLKREVRDAWKRTAEAAIQTLENQEIPGAAGSTDAAQAVLATEVKSHIMSEYRHRLEIFNDTAEAQALAFQMDQLEKRMRINALRAQRLELYRLHRHGEIGDDVLRIVLAELDLNEANLAPSK